MNNKQKIKQIKYLRLKLEERFVLDHLIDLEEYIHKNYPTSIFYKKDNVLLFEWDQKTGYFWCDYNNFWFILESKFNLNYEDIKNLIKIMVENKLIKKDITICKGGLGSRFMVEEQLVKKDITAEFFSNNHKLKVEQHLVKKGVTL